MRTALVKPAITAHEHPRQYRNTQPTTISQTAVTLAESSGQSPAHRAEQTVQFRAFDGTNYEIDLNAENAAAFSKPPASDLEHTTAGPGRGGHRPSPGRAGHSWPSAQW